MRTDLNEPPHSWVIIEPQFTLNQTSVEVLVATKETILVIDANEVQDQVQINNFFLKKRQKKKKINIKFFEKKSNSKVAHLNVLQSLQMEDFLHFLLQLVIFKSFQQIFKKIYLTLILQPLLFHSKLFGKSLLLLIILISHKKFSSFRCGNDSVVLYWPQILLMIGPQGEHISYDSIILLFFFFFFSSKKKIIKLDIIMMNLYF